MSGAGEVERVFPLTPLQRGMLLHSVTDADRVVYLNQAVFELTGRLDPAGLRSAWEATVAHHPALRTAFVWEGIDEPLQAVRPRVALPWRELDWRDGDAGGERLERYLEDDRARPLDLAAAPVMRLVLIRRADDRWWLVWSHHHLLLDGWSGALVLDEVFARYRAKRTGTDRPVAGFPPFWDYVAWLADRDPGAGDAYWRGRLAGFAEPTPLPGAAVAPRREGGFGEVHAPVPGPVADRLRELCRRRRVTLATVVQAAWALVLSRHAGRPDVLFGSMVSGRPAELPGADRMVGLLSNTLPVRVRVDDRLAVGEWLAGFQADLVAAREFEDSPLSRVQQHSEVPGGTPLFQSVVAVENYPVPQASGDPGELAMTGREFRERPHYPLALAVTVGDEMSFRLYVDWRWYDEPAVNRLAAQLGTALDALAGADDKALVGDLSVLPEAELALLASWAPGDAGSPLGRTVGEVFDDCATRHAGRPALWHAGAAISYAQLRERVHRLAGHLAAAGIGPEDPVAVLLPRTPALPVALLGTIRAGGAAVPMDPGYPPARIAALIRSSGARLLLTADETADVLPGDLGVPVLRLDRDGTPPGESSAPAPPPVQPDGLVYVIHTSGSTGEAKGVMATHAGVLNHLGWLQREFPIGPGERVAQRTSVSFDMSVWEVYWPLLTGACLIVPEAGPTDPEALAAELTQAGVTVTAVVPAALRAILADPERRFPPGLSTVFVAGEALPPGLLADLRRVTGARGMNGYGPTETSVVSVAWPLPDRAPDRIPIGRPVSGLVAHVLDSELRRVPVGAAGELYLAGAGIARGYLRRPGLTAERFVPDPFTTGSARMYRTGDVARWLPDGTLECLGRVDDQVKVRGYRVELGEIEASLAEHPAVRHAAVTVHGDGAGTGPKLAGYVVPRDEPVPVGDLREFLTHRLPEHMVPAHLVWLPELPTTTSGKVDRRALPAPDGVRPDLGAPFVPPRTEVERLLTEIWADVLGVDRVGVEDNFFELGGDSIMSLLVVSRAVRAGLRITVRQFFDHQVVASLATVAERVTGAADEPAAGRPRVAALTPVQQWFFGHRFARPGHWNMCMLLAVDPASAVDGPTLAERLRPVVAGLIDRHEALRTRFPADADGGHRLEVLPPGATDDTGLVRLVRMPDGGDWAGVCAEAMTVEFVLDEPLLLRVAVVDGGTPDRLRLALVAHHLVVDGVSWRILLEDLRTGYEQVVAGDPVRLAPAGTPPSGWAYALSRLAAEPAVAADATFWRAQTGADLPAARAPGGALERDVVHEDYHLPAEETRQLLREVPRAYRTDVQDVLLTALTLALARLTGRREVRLAVEGHGREQHLVPGTDLSRTVGWLTAIAPIRLTLPETDELPASLIAVKEQLRAIPHEGLSYGLLRYCVPEQVVAADDPVISVNYLGQVDASPAAGGRAGTLRLGTAPEPVPPAHHPANRRPFPLELTGVTVGGRLRLTFSRDRSADTGEARALAEETLVALRELIAHCAGGGTGRYSPSDFPESGLDQAQLDSLVGELTELG